MIQLILDNKIVLNKVVLADSFFKRLIGLLGKGKLDNEEGLLICHCRQVHTFFMKFNIDVVFLSKQLEVLYIQEDLAKNKISKYIKDSYYVLELNGKTAYNIGIEQGKQLALNKAM